MFFFSLRDKRCQEGAEGVHEGCEYNCCKGNSSWYTVENRFCDRPEQKQVRATPLHLPEVTTNAPTTKDWFTQDLRFKRAVFAQDEDKVEAHMPCEL